MFSKSLFKQSCKANGVMWTVITVAVCFMLACVMLISGGSSIGKSKSAIEDTIIKAEITSQTKKRAINYYEIADGAVLNFDSNFRNAFGIKYTSLIQEGYSEENAKTAASTYAYSEAAQKIGLYINAFTERLNLEETSTEYAEISGLIYAVINPLNLENVHVADSFYSLVGEDAPRIENLMALINESNYTELLKNYVQKNATIFLAGNMTNEDTISKAVNELASYGVTSEMYHNFGFDDYKTIKNIASSTLVNYIANVEFRQNNNTEGKTDDEIKSSVNAEYTLSLLSSLPQEVSDALDEIGKADLYGTLVGSIFFKMAGLLLPIIYMIMSSNALIAGQVDSGSMAYVLSTGTKRKEVILTQALFLISSLLVMFCCTTITSIVCLKIVDVKTKLDIPKLLLINSGSFLVMFGMSGICFFASCVFNRSKHSMALGGGLNMFFLVATMLGLFGSAVLPSIIRLDALNIFNYVSLISLFDVISILDGTLTYLWKFAILIVFGLALYIIGGKIFIKKDLPL